MLESFVGDLKKLYDPSPDLNRVSCVEGKLLYHVTVKVGLYRKTEQIYDIPYLITFTQ